MLRFSQIKVSVIEGKSFLSRVRILMPKVSRVVSSLDWVLLGLKLIAPRYWLFIMVVAVLIPMVIISDGYLSDLLRNWHPSCRIQCYLAWWSMYGDTTCIFPHPVYNRQDIVPAPTLISGYSCNIWRKQRRDNKFQSNLSKSKWLRKMFISTFEQFPDSPSNQER